MHTKYTHIRVAVSKKASLSLDVSKINYYHLVNYAYIRMQRKHEHTYTKISVTKKILSEAG